MPDDFSSRRPAGLACDDGAQFCGVQTFREDFDVRGFAGSLATLKGDESSAPRSPFDRCLGHYQSFSAPARNISLADRFRRIDRRIHGDVGAAPYPDDADLLTGLDRRTYRPIINHARDQFIGAVLVHHHLDRLGTGKFHRAALAAKHLGVADRLLCREQRPHLEVAKSPFEHLLGFGGAIVGIIEPVHDNNQPQAILHGGADHAVAAFLGVSGLQPVGALEGGQQRIAVLLPDLVPGEFALAK